VKSVDYFHMNAADLSTVLKGSQPPLLIHVLPPEHFAARRIRGAKNACVYEVAFLGNVKEFAPDLAQAIVVYGEGNPSGDSEEAARQLKAAGYSNVTDFRGGLREWVANGFPVEGDGSLPAALKLDGTFTADTKTSVIRWTGRNLFNFHHGHLALSEGEVVFSGGRVASAGFTIDMNSIACEDLTDPGYNAMLIKHLRTTDFFDVENHPTARFESTRIEPLSGVTDGSPTHRVTGLFTLRGKSEELTFPALIAAADTDHVTAQAVLEIDRTRWGSIYGSGKFFAYLCKHVVNDLIALHIRIAVEKA
jgi:polyisoprenoid-binding protein YceI